MIDIDPEIVEKISQRQSPIKDEYVSKYFKKYPLRLYATLDAASAIRDVGFLIIAVPAKHDAENNTFDANRIEKVIKLVMPIKPDIVIPLTSLNDRPRRCRSRYS